MWFVYISAGIFFEYILSITHSLLKDECLIICIWQPKFEILELDIWMKVPTRVGTFHAFCNFKSTSFQAFLCVLQHIAINQRIKKENGERTKNEENEWLDLANKITFSAFWNGVSSLRFELCAVFKSAFIDSNICLRIVVPLFTACMKTNMFQMLNILHPCSVLT